MRVPQEVRCKAEPPGKGAITPNLFAVPQSLSAQDLRCAFRCDRQSWTARQWDRRLRETQGCWLRRLRSQVAKRAPSNTSVAPESRYSGCCPSFGPTDAVPDDVEHDYSGGRRGGDRNSSMGRFHRRALVGPLDCLADMGICRLVGTDLRATQEQFFPA